MISRERSTGTSGQVDADDIDLIRRLAAGDHDVVRNLYRRYGGPLYTLGVRMLRDSSLAEDMVQETFVRLWRSSADFDPARGSPRTFIFTIGRRAAIDMIRRNRDGDVAALEGDITQEAHTSKIDEENLIAAMDVATAMTHLSDPHREVIEMAYAHDLSQTQIASRLGVPLGTVKTRTFHALRVLRTTLQDDGARA